MAAVVVLPRIGPISPVAGDEAHGESRARYSRVVMNVSIATSIFLLTLSPAALAGGSELAGDPRVAPRIRLFETWVGEQMTYQHQPGVVVGIVYEDELVWARGFGYRDLERRLPATPQTVFRLGSVSKTLTATAILQLRDQGTLRLDDPVAGHLPGLAYRNTFPQGPEITLRHLLTHTSGLPREAAFPYWTDRRFPTAEQMLEALAGQESVFEPGSHYKYSNLGLALLGEVVAEASGMPWEDYVRQHILEPLGMTETAARFADVDRERLATGYLIRRADGTWPVAPPTDARGLAPAAGFSSTLEDLARFVAAHLAGTPPILSSATRREMQRVQWLEPDWESGRGLGFSVWRQGGRTLVGHGGWVAGYRTQIAFDPEAGFGVIVLTNSDEGGPGSYVRQAFDFVIPAMEEVARPKREEPAAPGAERYAGAYHDPWGAATDFLVMDGRLATYEHGYPPVTSLEGALTELESVDEHTFRDPDGGELVTFELRPDGRVARVKVGENYLFPADCGSIGEDLQCSWE